MRRKDQICYLCGKGGADSRDHVPPEMLYYRQDGIGLPSDLITVPSHQTCQEKYSLDEEYFVITVTGGSFADKAAWAKWWNHISPRLKTPEKKRLSKRILNACFPVDIVSKSGIILGQATAVDIEIERINSIIGKIIRGLYFHHNDKILPFDIGIKILTNLQPEFINKSFIEGYKRSFPDAEFHYRGVHREFTYSFFGDIIEDKLTWFFRFFNHYQFFCVLKKLEPET